MPRPLGLHQITLMDLAPAAFVDVAAAAGYDHVSLFTNGPRVPLGEQSGRFVFPSVTRDNLAAVRARLDAHGLHVNGAEFFLMHPDGDFSDYREGLALARELGARHAVTHIFDADRERAAGTLARFCDLAADHDLIVGMEFCQMTPGCRSIDEAAWFVDRAARANLGFGICPLHLTRSGGTAADIAARDPRHVAFGQINDARGTHRAAAYYDEVHDRELPGDGDLPLAAILAALPADTPIEVKIPYERRQRLGISAGDFAAEAHRRSRALLDALK